MKKIEVFDFDKFQKEIFETYQLDNVLQREALSQCYPDPKPLFFLTKDLFEIGIIKGTPEPYDTYNLIAIIDGLGYGVNIVPLGIPQHENDLRFPVHSLFFSHFTLHLYTEIDTYITKSDLNKIKYHYRKELKSMKRKNKINSLLIELHNDNINIKQEI